MNTHDQDPAVSGTSRVPRLGVEEEFLLLDPATGRPLPYATQAGAARACTPPSVRKRCSTSCCSQETATPVCRTLPEVRAHLLRMRRTLADAANLEGCVLAACAASPFADGAWPVPVTDKPRYQQLHEQAPLLTDEQLINGQHVHVEIQDDQARIEALNRVRPWVPLLLALSASSPLWRGRDTGFASWRYLVNDRWPVSGIPPRFHDARDYHRRSRDLVDRQMVVDPGQLYWLARASARFPTLEVRAFDVQIRVDDAVALAGLVRALVMTVLAEAEAGLPAPDPAPEALAAAVWHAARNGLTGHLHDPRDLQPRPAATVVRHALTHLEPALQQAGDQQPVRRVMERLLKEGNGAVRLRRALDEHGWPAVLSQLGDHTQDR